MKTLFQLEHYPQYIYLTEDQLQKEYQSYLASCRDLSDSVQTAICIWLNFATWLDYMEYIVY